MQEDWKAPKGQFLAIEQAKALIAGELGDVCRSILMASCAPIFWYRVGERVLHNGTLTFVRTPKRLLGITAAHVMRNYERDQRAPLPGA